MKHFLLLVALFMVPTIVMANPNGMEKDTLIVVTQLPEREIIGDDVSEPSTRSIGQQLFYANLSDDVITLDDVDTLSDVTISILEANTEMIVISHQFSDSDNIVIDISELPVGYYILEVRSNKYTLIGHFEL